MEQFVKFASNIPHFSPHGTIRVIREIRVRHISIRVCRILIREIRIRNPTLIRTEQFVLFEKFVFEKNYSCSRIHFNPHGTIRVIREITSLWSVGLRQISCSKKLSVPKIKENNY